MAHFDLLVWWLMGRYLGYSLIYLEENYLKDANNFAFKLSSKRRNYLIFLLFQNSDTRRYFLATFELAVISCMQRLHALSVCLGKN